MLTEEGQEAARECILRSGLSDSSVQLTATNGSNSSLYEQSASHLASANRESTNASSSLCCKKELNAVPFRVKFTPQMFL